MVRVFVAVASFLGAAHSPAALSLLQISAEKDIKKVLPDVKTVLQKPQAAYKDVRMDVGSFEARLLEVQSSNEAQITAVKADLEQQLLSQKSENNAVDKFNADLTVDLASFRKDVTKLREQAAKLSKSNSKLVADLKSMQANITTAQDFVHRALNHSAELLETAPELQVLEQLNDMETEKTVGLVRAARLEEMRAGRRMTLVQIGEARGAKEVGAHELLDLMASALEDMQSEQNASEVAMRTAFDKDYAAGDKRHNTSLAKQQELNASKVEVVALKQRMTDAVQHLNSTHNMLSERFQAVRSFTKSMGTRHVAGSSTLSLLQIDTDSAKPSKKAAVADKPSTVYTSMQGHVGALAEQLQAVQSQGLSEAEDLKVEFDEQLLQIKKNISKQELENEKVVRDIKTLDMKIASLRTMSDEFVQKNSIIRNELLDIRSQIDLVQEFAVSSLQTTDENVSMTPELLIIGELDNDDIQRKQELAHQKTLEAITKKSAKQVPAKELVKKTAKKTVKTSKSQLSLLQFGSRKHEAKPQKADAHELLSTLAANLQQLMEEQDESKAVIQAAFDEEYANLTSKSAGLVEEWNTMNATRAFSKERIAKLEVALKHLKSTTKTLEKRRESLLTFGRTLSTRPDPLQKNAPAHAKKEAALLETASGNKSTWQPLSAFAGGLAAALR